MEEKRYQVIGRLSEGGSGITSLVWDKRLRKQWVMKEINLREEGQWEAAEAEIRALTAVHREGIPFLADTWHKGNKVFLIMEYIEGITLEQRIIREGALKENEIIRIGIELADLLQYLHGRYPAVIHGDVKASNVICRKEREGEVALLDFGASIVQCGEYQSDVSEGCHYTPGYAAPELIRTGSACVQTDVYAFGALLFAMAAGELPGALGWEPGAVREQNPFLSPQLEEVIEKCVEQDVRARYRTIEEVKLGLLACRGAAEGGRMERKEKKRAEKRLFQRVTSIVYTEGRTSIGTLLAVMVPWFCTGVLLFALFMNRAESVAAGKTLPVNMRSQTGDKILVDYGTVYHTDQNPLFELPKTCFEKQRKYEVTLSQRDCESGDVRKRVFLICME